MLKEIMAEINKLPPALSRQQALNWFIDECENKLGCRLDLTSEEIIFLIERSGRKVEGQSRLAIHISREAEIEHANKKRIDFGKRKATRHNVMPDSEKEAVRKLYWEQGLSMESIARKYNCSQGLVNRKMKEWQLKTRPRGSNIMTSTKSKARMVV